MNGNVVDEDSIESGLVAAEERFGTANILIVSSTNEEKRHEYPIWEMPLDRWEKAYQSNVRGSFLAIKHFLRKIHHHQQASGTEVANPAIVVVENETGAGAAAGKAGLHYGLLNSARQEIGNLNSEGRINAVTSAGKTPDDVARTLAFLASRRAAGNISGQCIQVDTDNVVAKKETSVTETTKMVESIPRDLGKPKRNKIRVAVSIDLDAVSGWLGTSM